MDEAKPDFGYMPGFGNTHSTSAEPGALPIGRNSPQKPPLGLYAEQLSGTAFTAPRVANLRSWTYRILPSVREGARFAEVDGGLIRTAPCREGGLPAGQLRWPPLPIPAEGRIDFLEGLATIATCGDAAIQAGMASHVYVANQSMERKYLANGDGEMLIVPQTGALRLCTEFGVLVAGPLEVAVIPRGVKFRVELLEGPVRGYICENYGASFAPPERGPIGANGLANERDFLYPVAAYEDVEEPGSLYLKLGGRLFSTTLTRSPLDVVAWHGDYAPYKYDLRRFCPVGAIAYDHPDPSIFTVLTSPSNRPGVANADFVIFPDRWQVAEDTFRPPWYHINCMSEFMGLITGVYDAKPGGFVPGGMSLHNGFLAHGPDAEAFEKASNKALQPEKLTDTMAFMFETRFMLDPTAFASAAERLDAAYPDAWSALEPMFRRPARN
jgi:homogentisate 1,2-dioxygenase